MSDKKFIVGHSYKGVFSGSIYLCKYVGEHAAVLSQGSSDVLVRSLDYGSYEEYVVPKVETSKMFVHYNKASGKPYYVATDNTYDPQRFSNEAIYLTFTDGKLTAVSLTDHKEPENV